MPNTIMKTIAIMAIALWSIKKRTPLFIILKWNTMNCKIINFLHFIRNMKLVILETVLVFALFSFKLLKCNGLVVYMCDD